MPELDAALDEIRGFASRAPGEGPDIDRIVALASRRRRRQRVMGTIGVVLVAASLLAVAANAGGRDDAPPVAPSTTASTDAMRPAVLTVVPSVDLEPDDVVGVTMPVAPQGDDIVAQCASEADGPAPEQWCETAVAGTERVGDEDFRVQVHRVISTSNGLIDCAERPARCVLGVRSGGRDYLAPISFRTDLPALVPPALQVQSTGVGTVTATGTGFQPGTDVFLTQCRPSADQDAGDAVYGDCDYARASRPVTDADGRFQVDVTLFRDIFEAYTGWDRCTPCQLQARESRSPTAVAVVDATRASTDRPQVEIVPTGPYRPGQVVQLDGTGFSPDAAAGDIAIGWCRFATDDPTREQAGAGPQYATCAYPGVDVTVASDGTFTLRDFPLPDAAFGYDGATCESPDARCGLAWFPSEGSLPVFVTEFTIRR